MLSKTIDPIKLAKQQTSMNGDISLNQMSRLEAICEQKDRKAKVDLQFGVDHKTAFLFVRGHINATVDLICQRCNGLMTYSIDAEFLLSPVLSEERAKQLPKQYEPLLVQNGDISVCDMIEDEILLVLPMVPKHEECEMCA